MAVFFDDTVNGSDRYDFGAQRVFYLLFHTFDIGVVSRAPSETDVDYRLRLGWLAFGTSVEVPDLGTEIFWRAPIWLNFRTTIWTPDPQTDPAVGDFAIWATHIRWALTTGVEGRLIVIGY